MQIILNGAWDIGSKILVVVFICFLFSCRKENMGDCFKGTGTIISEYRMVEQPFYKVEVEDNISLVLIQSADHSVKIEAGKNLIDLIETEFKDYSLTIRNNNKCNWMRSYNKPITAYVSLPDLISLQYRSSGDVVSQNKFILDSLRVESWGGAGTVTMNVDCGIGVYAIHTGTGDLKITGNSGVSYVWNSGNGFFFGEDLKTNYTYISTQGTGDCYVNADLELGATILHIGNIYYRGNANVTSDIRGSGSLIKLD